MAKATTPQQQELVPQIKKEKEELSKLQKQFNSKIKRIGLLKTVLAERKGQADELRKRVMQELQPLTKQIIDARVEFLLVLDKACSMPLFRKKEREKLSELIEDLAFHLIEDYGREDLIPLHDKYAAFTHQEVVEQAAEEARDQAQNMFKNIFGVELDPESLDEIDDLDAVHEKLKQKLGEQEQAKKAGRKKTKAQLAKEEAMKAELDNMSKASRRIYTNLAKQLHPDREQDEALREWKEEEMKKVTAAYEKNDFFELLRLQMEFLQEKDKALDNVPEDQLQYYLNLLKEQLHKLEDELRIFNFGPDGMLLGNFSMMPKQIEQRFRAEKAKLKRDLKQVKDDVKYMQDPDNVRLLIKQMK